MSHIKSFYMDCGDKKARNNHVVSEKFLKSNEKVFEIIKNKIPYSLFKVIKNAEHHYKYFIDRVPNLFIFLNQDTNSSKMDKMIEILEAKEKEAIDFLRDRENVKSLSIKPKNGLTDKLFFWSFTI
ncbi:hypothetical protein [Neobacillus niacini]|uniref:hypothetical protein n=1 Tax=Neobacillus niacini TaxID=86668 RepID=UPI00285B3DD0|nr:hypothetical protein [Neobacillus niacini]MDR6999704.1 hypothetical protein [Neobacillus niacini]